VHRQRRFVSPNDGPVRVKQQHYLGQTGDNLLKPPAIRAPLRHSVIHDIEIIHGFWLPSVMQDAGKRRSVGRVI
jgi:hypothetical protein